MSSSPSSELDDGASPTGDVGLMLYEKS